MVLWFSNVVGKKANHSTLKIVVSQYKTRECLSSFSTHDVRVYDHKTDEDTKTARMISVIPHRSQLCSSQSNPLLFNMLVSVTHVWELWWKKGVSEWVDCLHRGSSYLVLRFECLLDSAANQKSLAKICCRLLYAKIFLSMVFIGPWIHSNEDWYSDSTHQET